MTKAYNEVIENLMTTSGLDLETCNLVLETYIHQSQEILGDLYSCSDKVDYSGLKDLFHKLKGSSGNVRFEAVRALSEKAEVACKLEEMDTIRAIVKEIEGLIKTLEGKENAE